MDGSRPISAIADVNAALDWWREAGVDCDFVDTPRQWQDANTEQANASDQKVVPGAADSFPALKSRPAPPPPPPAALLGGARADWPRELADFAAWWLGEPALDGGQTRGRVPPRGPIDPQLMVLVPEPEAQDGDILLSGPHGKLLTAMLAAMGLDPDQVYFASALPRHTPMADWTDLAAQGLGDVLRHHIRLARPRRLIAFGRHVSHLLEPKTFAPALAATAPAQKSPVTAGLSHVSDVPILVARDLGSLLDRPIAKGNFWQHWLEWSAGG